MTPDTRLTYTVDEAAKLLGIGRGSAYEAVRADELPHVRLGRRVLIPRQALLELLGENNDAGRTSPAPAMLSAEDGGGDDPS